MDVNTRQQSRKWWTRGRYFVLAGVAMAASLLVAGWQEDTTLVRSGTLAENSANVNRTEPFTVYHLVANQEQADRLARIEEAAALEREANDLPQPSSRSVVLIAGTDKAEITLYELEQARRLGVNDFQILYLLEW